MCEMILYTSEDGKTHLQLRKDGPTVWLTQLEIAELFQTTKQNVSLHAMNILKEGELLSEATVKESLTVQNEGNRPVKRKITHYNLDLIQAIIRMYSAPKGRDRIALGSALGKTGTSESKPQRGGISFGNGGVISPFQGLVSLFVADPGRCPGLSYPGPLGLRPLCCPSTHCLGTVGRCRRPQVSGTVGRSTRQEPL